MLKKTLTALSLASVASIMPFNLNAEEKGTYFVGSIGAGKMENIDIAASLGGGEFEFDTGFSGEIGIGYDFGKIRTELSYTATNTDLIEVQNVGTDIGVDVSSWMISAAYDWRADKKWQPYVSAGVGSSTIEVDLARTIGSVAVVVDDDDISTFKVKAGVNYEASENIDIYGELWGQAFDDFTIGTLEFQDCGMSGISLGVRIKV
tara:strand:+ start:161 stop:775 length:615 start_codon:yes stop_codon:yes gene_type:complete